MIVVREKNLLVSVGFSLLISFYLFDVSVIDSTSNMNIKIRKFSYTLMKTL